MSQTVITAAFEEWKAQEAAGGNRVVLDGFVLAYIPGLNPDTPVSNIESMPPESQIVYRQDVDKCGVVNNNAVVYSITMGSNIGTFDFNWIGLVNKASGVLAMIVHTPVQQKIKTEDGQQGNAVNRSFLMEYDGAATETEINTPAQTWQIDFTARLAGMDDEWRLANFDIYGQGAFFGDGFLVKKDGSQYSILPGVGYVGGVRALLSADQDVATATLPAKVYVDVSWQGSLTGRWQAVTAVTASAEELADHIDVNGFAHYVFAVASIDAAGVVTDLRPIGSLPAQVADGAVKSVNTHKPDNTGNVKMGSAADNDLTSSARDTTADHVLKTADYGIGRATGTVTTGIDFKSFVFIQGEHLFVKMDTCTNIPAGLNAATYYYLFVKGMRDSDGSPCIELVNYDTPSEVWNAYGAGAAGSRVWTLYRSFNSGYKQTAADTGAMPYYGTALGVDLNTLGAYSAAGIYYQPGNAGATTANHYPVAEAGTLEVTPGAYGCQHEYTTFGTGRKFVRGLSAAWNGKDGPWSAWKEYFQSAGGAVSGTINQDGVAQATYKYTALSTATVGVKNYLRKMRGGNGDTIWHETVQAGEYRIATGNTDAQDEFVISSTGRVTFRGEVVSKSANGFRIAYGTYGVFLRSDGNNTYLLLTASGDLLGNYNSLRPFTVNNATGDVTIGKLTLSNYASFDARYLTVSSTLQRLGAQVVVSVPNKSTVSAPAGCVASAVKCGNDGALTGFGYRPQQILVNGQWVNVQSL